MTPRTVILNLGFPRTGTTLVQRMFEQGSGYFHQKITEAHPLHPLQTPHVAHLANVFHHKRVVIVRTTRSFPEVWESLRVGNEDGNIHPWVSEAGARAAYEREAQNWLQFVHETERPPRDKAQMLWHDFLTPWLHPQVEVHAHTFSYDRLQPAPVQGLRAVAALTNDEGSNLRSWENYLAEVWLKKPVNVGRLKRRIKY